MQTAITHKLDEAAACVFYLGWANDTVNCLLTDTKMESLLVKGFWKPGLY